MQNMIPQVLNDFECYTEGDRILGLVTATLPEINNITSEFKGAGIAGQIDFPVMGNFESMELGLTFHTLFDAPIKLMKPGGNLISLRGAIQGYNPGTGAIKIMPLRVDARIHSKGLNLGKMEPAAEMETESSYALDYIKIVLDGVTVVEIDIFNYICLIDGVDYMEEIKAAVS